ncbi:isoprenoid synthase domain-containing protein [Mycena vulgaris]|nr:isoprenoid synthase domain-containing protein [Mycena vulgaris]
MENLPMTFRLPPLMAIFDEFKATRVHPSAEEAKREAIKWFSRYEKIDARLPATISDSVTAVVFPDVNLDDLLLSTQFQCWGFLIDDLVDDDRVGPEGVRDLIQMLEDIQHNRPLEEGRPFPLVIQIFQVIWDKMRELKRPCFEHRFGDTLSHWSDSLLQVFRMGRGNDCPDIETYKVFRGRNSGMECLQYFTGFLHGLNLDDQVLDSTELKEVIFHLNAMTWLANDVISWNMEQSRGEICNLVSLIMIHEKKTVQDAMDDAEQMLRSHAAKFRSAKTRALETFREHKDIKDLESFIQANQMWPHIAVRFSFHAAHRYFRSPEASDEAQSTGVVHVMPRQRGKSMHVEDDHH